MAVTSSPVAYIDFQLFVVSSFSLHFRIALSGAVAAAQRSECVHKLSNNHCHRCLPAASLSFTALK
jgi:hypothetical protein